MEQYFRTKKFNEVFTSSSTFISEFSSSAFSGIVTETSLNLIYALLDAKYGNSRIANVTENQFKNKCFATIWQYAPTWQRKLEIQQSLRELTESDITTGSKQINDHAFNPSTIINTTSGEIDSVNEQTKSRMVKSKLDGYGNLLALLEKDVTEEFMSKFKRLFYVAFTPEYPTEEDEA